MATQEVISAVIDRIVAAFDGDVELFDSWLKRSRLETDLAAIESAIRQAQDSRDSAVDSAEATIQTLEADKQAKLAEIDNL